VNRGFLVDVQGDFAVVRLAGELDIAAVPAITRAIGRATAMGVRSVRIDLTAVTFLDSSGLGAIVAGWRDAERLGLGFDVGDPTNPAVAKVLAITGLQESLKAQPARDENEASG
jgi:anti-sigma B factor antagonist